MTDWQPIETAPRDGTVIDVWCTAPPGEDFRFPEVHWDPEDGGGWADNMEMLVEYHGARSVTHWMPLPQPPVQQTETSGPG